MKSTIFFVIFPFLFGVVGGGLITQHYAIDPWKKIVADQRGTIAIAKNGLETCLDVNGNLLKASKSLIDTNKKCFKALRTPFYGLACACQPRAIKPASPEERDNLFKKCITENTEHNMWCYRYLKDLDGFTCEVSK